MTVRFAAGTAGAAALLIVGLTAPAQAVTYGTPTIALSASYLSGAVGATGDPVVNVTVGQSGADVSALTVSASASSRASVAGTGDVTVTGAGAVRQLAVAARGRGYTNLTVKVTGLGTWRGWSSRPAPRPPPTWASGPRWRRPCRAARP
ncbi:hypothetical protein [Streptomyces sp. NBC_01233]|uniref:hypothetical protein n=1 Tax=Streptomyces sp. NBC_01233 TaxID=2903787 RepID=UPI003FA38F53